MSLEESLRDTNAPVHPDDRAPAEAAWADKAKLGEPFEYELRMRRHDGIYRWFLARCVPAFDPSGQLSGWYGTSTDIHDRKLMEDALRASEAQFRTLSESLPDMLWISDATGQPIYQNPAWKSYTGLTSQQLATQGFSTMHHPDDTQRVLQVWEQANRMGEPFEIEMRMRRHDGIYRWCNGRTAPIKDQDGNIIRWIGTIADVHDRKVASRNNQFLADIGKHLTTSTNPQDLMWQVVEAIAQHFAVSRAGFASFDAEAGRITLYRDYHANATSLAGNYPQWWLPAEYLDQLNAGKSLVIHDFISDERTSSLYSSAFAWTGLRAGAAVPLLRHDRCVAVLFIADNAARQWADDEIELLRTVAERAWLTLESNRVHLETQVLNTLLESRVAERTHELEQSREQLRQLTSHVAQAREDERARIAREVHDQLGGALTVAKMSLAQITKRLTMDEDLAKRIEDFRNQIDELVQTSRRISYDLRPSMLDDFGLFAAIEWQAHDWERRTGILCKLDLDDEEVGLNSASRTAVFRAFQESLTNIARHAQATQVHVSAQVSGQHMLLSVRDNGCGISMDRARNGKSMGLLGMRERIREVAGDVEISSKPGEGTIVALRVPISA
jgi:PAS domain S-box-containing protein